MHKEGAGTSSHQEPPALSRTVCIRRSLGVFPLSVWVNSLVGKVSKQVLLLSLSPSLLLSVVPLHLPLVLGSTGSKGGETVCFVKESGACSVLQDFLVLGFAPGLPGV